MPNPKTHPRSIQEALAVLDVVGSPTNLRSIFRLYGIGENSEASNLPSAIGVTHESLRALRVIFEFACALEVVQQKVLPRTSADLYSLARLFAEESKEACQLGGEAVEALRIGKRY